VPEQRLKPVYAYQDWQIDLAQRELRLRGAPVPLGSRAFEVIEVLVEAVGDTINKYDLMERVWPGAVVEENTLQFHISAVRKALGRDRGMLKTVFGRGYRLLGKWTIREESEPAHTDALEQPHTADQRFLNNLPAAVSYLIGRATAVKQLQDFLGAYRVVTLVGLGGVGKTTLALQVARDFSATFQGDAVLVELASLSDPSLVPSAVATSLGHQLGGYQITPRSVAQSIGRRRLLLVLDNCEHLIDAAAQLAEMLVRTCPGASILATSREPLRIEGEHVYHVPPLDVPPVDRDSSDALQHSAVQLFIARIRGNSNFSLQEGNLSAIAAICQRLDGIPLAIEFAAARATTLGVHHVASRLNDRFNLLVGTRRTALPRHQTLRATLDWSYELLSESEQHLFRHLAGFPGGFTIKAAAAMAGASESETVEGRISNLVWKSLLTLIQSTDDPRWRPLETIRAYGLEKLAENGEVEQAARRHAEFFRDLFAPAEDTPLVTLDDLPRYIREIDNVRAALDWAFSRGGDKAVGIALTAAYAPVWLHLSLIAECRDRVERARDNSGAASNLSPKLKAQLLTILGLVQSYTGAAGEGTGLALTEALTIAESLNDPEAQLQALYAIWTHKFIPGELHTAQKIAERIALIAPHTGDPADTLVADRLLGSTNHYGGNHRRAQHHFESAVNRYTAPSGRRRAMWLHFDGRVLPRARLARTLWMRGFAGRALQVAKASLEDAQIIDHKLSMCFALAEAVCPLHLMAGDIAAATRYITMLSELAARHSFVFVRLAHCLQGVLLIKRGDAAQGSKLLRSAFEDLSGAGRTPHGSGIAIDFTTPVGSGFVADFAEALASLGNLAEASTVTDSALAQSRHEGVRWHMPELLRMKGELLIRRFDDRSFSAAEHLLSEAFELAEEQAALFWQLRVAVSHARLKVRQHRAIEARTILAPICGAFAAEPEFSDLGIARKLLNSLPAGAAG
jgi:predicted ATPase/DNA-binding winged helix-turn-helix (wHTH) protein